MRQACYYERSSSEEQVDALRDNELPNVAHDTVPARIEFAQSLRRANLTSPGGCVMGFKLVGEPGQADDGLVLRARVEGVHVHPGRTKPCPLGQRGFIGDHLPYTFTLL